MYDKDSKGISFTAGFFMLIAFTIAASVLAYVISKYVWQSMTGLDFSMMLEASKNPANRDAVRVVHCISAVVGFLLPAIVTAWALNHRPMKLMGFTPKMNWQQIAIVCVIMFTALWVSTSFSYLNDHLPLSDSLRQTFDKMEQEYTQQASAILGLTNISEYLIAIAMMAIIPAVCEEALFRGGLQNYLTRATRKPWLSIIIVSIIFSALHFSFYGFLSRLFLGIVLGLIFEYSGKLWLSIIAHFFNNAFAVTVVYIMSQNGKPINEAMAENDGTWAGVLALPVVIALLIFFKKIAGKPKEFPDGTVKNEELRNTPFY
ncbi:MAG: CPBP family intramembrane metalloprotease [Chitinophagaceae bacterium]|nr:CPBP family intramembrane metalloprotease [Chitinophagaceae bacterium]